MIRKIKTYCINLERRPDRKEAMEEQFARFGKFFDVTYIKAVDGKELKTFPRDMGTANKYGCLLSHRNAVLEIIKNEDEFALILEDDVVFSETFINRFNKAFDCLPLDWDMFYLSYFPQPTSINPNRTFHYSGELYKMTGQLGAFAYVVSGSMAESLSLAFLEPNHFTDNKLSFYQKNHQCYAIEPFLCYVKEDYSDLSESIVNYEQIKNKFKD